MFLIFLAAVSLYFAAGTLVFGLAEAWLTFGRSGVTKSLPGIGRSLLLLGVAFAAIALVNVAGIDLLLAGAIAFAISGLLALRSRRHPRTLTPDQVAMSAAMKTERGRRLRMFEYVWLVGFFVVLFLAPVVLAR